ncbi:hypothetical protein DCS_03345 [Drechmeria coniospora]|uniref:BolA-like protein n=1 Tax=Drechmeria coniospora TaxID=98403 RepID=A0A151GGX8_DRECN|nr:hypothetical protein DCS_03345 [Drechmeria coniospora]KYK56345.1 hypothetical protein DCS_03345 [Drechmeria coniospora]
MICSSCRASLRQTRIFDRPPSALRSFSRTSLAVPFASSRGLTIPESQRQQCRLLRTPRRRPASLARLFSASVSSARLFSASVSSASSASSNASSSQGNPARQESGERQKEEEEVEYMSPAEASIAALLADKLAPTSHLLVQDVSGGCGSMYAIQVASPRFRGQSLLKQQRMVNAALGDLVKSWHGVQIRTIVPDE